MKQCCGEECCREVSCCEGVFGGSVVVKSCWRECWREVLW